MKIGHSVRLPSRSQGPRGPNPKTSQSPSPLCPLRHGVLNRHTNHEVAQATEATKNGTTKDFSNEEFLVICESARVALADAEVFDTIADQLDIADDELKRVVEKLQAYLDFHSKPYCIGEHCTCLEGKPYCSGDPDRYPEVDEDIEAQADLLRKDGVPDDR